jgi:hypothetical protein
MPGKAVAEHLEVGVVGAGGECASGDGCTDGEVGVRGVLHGLRQRGDGAPVAAAATGPVGVVARSGAGDAVQPGAHQGAGVGGGLRRGGGGVSVGVRGEQAAADEGGGQGHERREGEGQGDGPAVDRDADRPRVEPDHPVADAGGEFGGMSAAGHVFLLGMWFLNRETDGDVVWMWCVCRMGWRSWRS